ncbi:MAG: 1-deoxy-D-xylulose-5-phosphate reductoisomerase [Gammaproteobacteria bacterium]|nr:MAG: 1-deoxy-D-xylulose-5-phosphate reductoisomerase [Gammaproteobacteria bacterium]TND07098.1 MAG: 1-deoxy-D-xylulose-5-phosphate reductoisomerase [Gammaproteobacteria bacterium]
MIGITVLGATGSIGVSTLDVVSRHRDRYRVVALTANTEVDRLYEQCMTCRPQYAAMADDASARRLRQRLEQAGAAIEVLSGVDGLKQVATLDSADYVMAAIVGAAGLLPTLAAARAGKRILLANKEALVMSGAIFMDDVRRGNARLFPIDSEHNAIFQCLPPDFSRGLAAVGVRKIFLTASGGPFRTTALDKLRSVTPAQACAHPNWVMGRKISVDSATMMNKGLEVIEACWLFNTTPENVQVVLHPQSVVHSLVEYEDGSVLAQLGSPDMRTPIAHALAWPERIASGVTPLNLFDVARLDFEEPDMARFPCLGLAYQAMDQGGTATAILNAANEVAVQAFLAGSIAFTSIPVVIEHTLGVVAARSVDSLAVVLEDDAAARSHALSLVRRDSSRVAL